MDIKNSGMKLKENEYQCALCGRVSQKGWSDKEAMSECINIFGEMMTQNDDLGIACDDCYKSIIPSEHPEEMTKAKEEFLGKMN
jgi:hypothetical protein